jgi:hypothetical protein
MPHHHGKRKPPRRIASLVACKHCGSPYNFGEKVGDWHEVETVFFVVCTACGAAGPKAATAAEAVTGWEHSAAPISIKEAPPTPGWNEAAPKTTQRQEAVQ